MSSLLAPRNQVYIEPSLPEVIAPRGSRLLSARGQTMGTGWTLKAWGAEGADGPMREAVTRACAETIALFSLWSPESSVMRFNRAPTGWVLMPRAVIELLQDSLHLAALTGGALDPALGRLADLWGFGPAGPKAHAPSAPALATARAQSGASRLALDRDTCCIWQPGGLWLDFGGIAKGWAVDLASRYLARAGYRAHMIEIGGEIAARGLSPEGQPWWVEIETRAPRRHLAALHSGAVASSGHWRRRSGEVGQDWGHSLDPRTGQPVADDGRGVHVFHPRAALADAWASALMVLPLPRAQEIANAHGIAALFSFADGRVIECGLADWRDEEDADAAC